MVVHDGREDKVSVFRALESKNYGREQKGSGMWIDSGSRQITIKGS